jgi:cyclopropane fatty-acyl-phospholipid synthase-like methyltransferase
MKLTKQNILNLEYKNNPDKLLGMGCATYYTDMFLKVLIKEFDFFNRFKNSKLTKEGIVKKFKIKDRPANVFLPILVKKGFLDVKDNKYFLTDFSKEFLLSSSKKYFADFIIHATSYIIENQLYNNIKSIMKSDKPVYSTKNGDWIKNMKANKDFAQTFTRALDERGLFLANSLVKKINLKNYKRMVDIGGSSGIYSCFISTYFPNLNIDILEISSVVPQTKKLIKERGFSNKINVISGDMFNYNYNQEYDVHFYSNVLHDWNKKDVKKLLKRSYNNLPKNGIVVIHDGHKDIKNNPMSLLENDISLLMITPGRYYFEHEIFDILKEIGFKAIKKKEVFSGRSLIFGKK